MLHIKSTIPAMYKVTRSSFSSSSFSFGANHHNITFHRSSATSRCKKCQENRKTLQILPFCYGEFLQSLSSDWRSISRVIPNQESDYDLICTYIRNSQNHGFGMTVVDIARIERKGDAKSQQDKEEKGQLRMMLWHGTTIDCVLRIVESGLKIPALKNQMFGAGIYLSDRASKSAQYCSSSKPCRPPKDSIGYLFLCDVLIGNCFNARKPMNAATCSPVFLDGNGLEARYDSVKCAGRYVPNRLKDISRNGIIWPIGETVQNHKCNEFIVDFNEYVVYDATNAKPVYLVTIKF